MGALELMVEVPLQIMAQSIKLTKVQHAAAAATLCCSASICITIIYNNCAMASGSLASDMNLL